MKKQPDKGKITALYERLSHDDERAGESVSIENQKRILEDYAQKNGFTNIRHFTDDGVRGTTFKRPGLDAMLEEIRAGNVATVIIKDQSRIGRDVVEVGLLKRTFDEYHVRFIAANDNLDTANGFDIMSIFRDVINEWYVADTSRKIKTVFKSRMEKGLRCSGSVSYGYQKTWKSQLIDAERSFNMNNVLIIEDDKEICVMIKDHLEKYNYQVFFTLTGANAIERIKELSPDLIILDLMLPFISGDELIRNIRKFSDVPVIVVSAKSLTFNKVELLRLGADDYLTKPFDLDELLARIERNLLRSQKDTPHLCLTFGELSINTSSKIVTVADEIIVLTAKEYQLVELLAKYPDKVFSKQNLYESIWQEPFARDNDVINTHISNLRKKLKGEGCRIKTIWGLGYRFAK